METVKFELGVSTTYSHFDDVKIGSKFYLFMENDIAKNSPIGIYRKIGNSRARRIEIFRKDEDGNSLYEVGGTTSVSDISIVEVIVENGLNLIFSGETDE